MQHCVLVYIEFDREKNILPESLETLNAAAKVADNAARMAALFHVFEDGAGGSIGLASFEAASRITAWHLNEAKRLLGRTHLSEKQKNAALLDEWLIDRCRQEGTNTIRQSVVLQYGPNPIRQKVKLDAALSELESPGRLRCGTDGNKKVIIINPGLLAR